MALDIGLNEVVLLVVAFLLLSLMFVKATALFTTHGTPSLLKGTKSEVLEQLSSIAANCISYGEWKDCFEGGLFISDNYSKSDFEQMNYTVLVFSENASNIKISKKGNEIFVSVWR